MARKKLELLSPAGSLDALKAAYANGADAVYLGAAAFGARASAGFDEEKLREALRIAGRDYTVTIADAPERVRRVAVYIDRKIAETGASGFVNRESAAVIAGLTVADELLTAQDDNTRLRRELLQARQELQELKHAST